MRAICSKTIFINFLVLLALQLYLALILHVLVGVVVDASRLLWCMFIVDAFICLVLPCISPSLMIKNVFVSILVLEFAAQRYKLAFCVRSVELEI